MIFHILYYGSCYSFSIKNLFLSRYTLLLMCFMIVDFCVFSILNPQTSPIPILIELTL